jgi:hypothetical protein
MTHKFDGAFWLRLVVVLLGGACGGRPEECGQCTTEYVCVHPGGSAYCLTADQLTSIVCNTDDGQTHAYKCN